MLFAVNSSQTNAVSTYWYQERWGYANNWSRWAEFPQGGSILCFSQMRYLNAETELIPNQCEISRNASVIRHFSYRDQEWQGHAHYRYRSVEFPVNDSILCCSQIRYLDVAREEVHIPLAFGIPSLSTYLRRNESGCSNSRPRWEGYRW